MLIQVQDLSFSLRRSLRNHVVIPMMGTYTHFKPPSVRRCKNGCAISAIPILSNVIKVQSIILIMFATLDEMAGDECVNRDVRSGDCIFGTRDPRPAAPAAAAPNYAS